MESAIAPTPLARCTPNGPIGRIDCERFFESAGPPIDKLPDSPSVTPFVYHPVIDDEAGGAVVTPFVDSEDLRSGSGKGAVRGPHTNHVTDIRPAQARDIEHLSEKLGVSAESLRRLDIGVSDKGWVFPMTGPGGRVVGHRVRYFKGGKGTLAGGQLGLFVPAGTNPAAVDTITEGESDLPAALDIGLRAIGTPGATACIAETVEYLAPQRFNGITIVADRDDNGVGLDGANKRAAALLDDGHLVRVVLPPQGLKDLREWHHRDGLTFASFSKHANTFPWQVPQGTPPGWFSVGNWQVRAGLIATVGCTAFAVLTAIASNWDKDGLCRIGRDEIGALIGKGSRTVDRHLNALKVAGVLEVVERGHEGRWNVYRLHLGPFNCGYGMKVQAQHD